MRSTCFALHCCSVCVACLQALDARTTGAYLCGPEPFMAAVTAALQELGFPGNHIYSESFSF